MYNQNQQMNNSLYNQNPQLQNNFSQPNNNFSMFDQNNNTQMQMMM